MLNEIETGGGSHVDRPSFRKCSVPFRNLCDVIRFENSPPDITTKNLSLHSLDKPKPVTSPWSRNVTSRLHSDSCGTVATTKNRWQLCVIDGRAATEPRPVAVWRHEFNFVLNAAWICQA